MPRESERHAGREVAFSALPKKDSRPALPVKESATQLYRVAFYFDIAVSGNRIRVRYGERGNLQRMRCATANGKRL